MNRVILILIATCCAIACNGSLDDGSERSGSPLRDEHHSPAFETTRDLESKREEQPTSSGPVRGTPRVLLGPGVPEQVRELFPDAPDAEESLTGPLGVRESFVLPTSDREALRAACLGAVRVAEEQGDVAVVIAYPRGFADLAMFADSPENGPLQVYYFDRRDDLEQFWNER